MIRKNILYTFFELLLEELYLIATEKITYHHVKVENKNKYNKHTENNYNKHGF